MDIKCMQGVRFASSGVRLDMLTGRARRQPMAADHAPQRATWSTPGEAARVVARGPNLRRTTVTALIVGTVLFLINHLPTVLAGQASVADWVQTGVTYLVPFTVANIGLLVGTRSAG
jgi:hypothetical protein